MTNMTEFTFLSTDGKTQLHGMRWEPDGGSVRAVLQICHGVAEHIARYDAFARYLNGLGIAVVGHDHLGHGLSLPEGGTPVYFGESNTWNTVVDDIYVLHQRIRLWYPDVPLCIMGHSMGSFLTRTYLIRYPGTVKAAIIMGTGWQPKAVIAGGMAVAKAVGAVVGENGTSDLVTNLAFGAYNKLFAPTAPAVTGCPPTRTMWTPTWPIPCAAPTPRWVCSGRCCRASASTRSSATCGKWIPASRCCSSPAKRIRWATAAMACAGRIRSSAAPVCRTAP